MNGKTILAHVLKVSRGEGEYSQRAPSVSACTVLQVYAKHRLIRKSPKALSGELSVIGSSGGGLRVTAAPPPHVGPVGASLGEVGGPWGPRYPLGVAGRKRRGSPRAPPPALRRPMGAARGRGVGGVGGGRAAEAAEAAEVAAEAEAAGAARMAKSLEENGPRAPAAEGSLSGTRESLAPGPDAAAADELSSLGSDSETNGFAERRIDKFGFIVGSQGAEGA